VTNGGPDTAQSVAVTDSLPSEVTFVDCTSDQGGVCGGTTSAPTVSFSSLASGVTATITIHVTVNSNVTSGTLITNNASVTSVTGDSNGGNNTTSATTTVQEVSAGQLVISEFRTRGPAGASDEFVEIYNPTTTSLVIGGLKIRASNGTGTISDRVTITAGTTLGPGCHYLIANSSASGYSGATIPNQTYTTGITDDGGIAITRNNGTTIIDQVGMSAGSAYKEGTTLTPLTNNVDQSYERKPGGSFGNGTDTNNNSADFFLNASSSNPQNSSTGCLNTSGADLSITKTDSPDPVTIGSNITYTITVLNNGAATAQNIQITDNLPAEVTFFSCNATGGAVCSAGGGNNRTVTLASLASGSSFTATIVATANGPDGTTASNTATVSSSTTDANLTNNTATATTLMKEPTPNLSINDVTMNEGNSGTTTFMFTVTLSPSSSQTVTVNYATADGTATAPSDYTAISSTPLTFAPGETTKTVNVLVNGDTTVEPDEAFTVNLSGNSANSNISDAQGVGTITNDDGATVVISQIYAGGGNTGAQYTNDFVELFNRTTTAIDISNWSIQTATGTGTAWTVTRLCPVSQTCTIGANRYYLIKLAAGGTPSGALPTEDATGTVNLATAGNKIALVSSTTAFTGTAAGTSPLAGATCPTPTASLVDFVGFGSATCSEGTAAAALSNTTALFRGGSGCTDTNSNSADFSAAAPAPRNSATAPHTCP
jgi:uncharacterized repeat protein (TIGR01451 family)